MWNFFSKKKKLTKDSVKNFTGEGEYTFANEGKKYVGEWKDSKYHGYGTYTYANGTKENGYFMNGDFVPDICEDMGLKQGTSEFGQCVLKLIETIVE